MSVRSVRTVFFYNTSIEMIRTHLHCKDAKEAIPPHIPQDLESFSESDESYGHIRHTKGPVLVRKSVSVFVDETLLSSREVRTHRRGTLIPGISTGAMVCAESIRFTCILRPLWNSPRPSVAIHCNKTHKCIRI